MEARVAAIRDGTAPELVWLVEHPPLYTAGTSAEPHELLSPDRFPVFATGRGGKYTYHGPGQRIVYVMLDLDARGRDLRAYVAGHGSLDHRRAGRSGRRCPHHSWQDRGVDRQPCRPRQDRRDRRPRAALGQFSWRSRSMSRPI